MNRSVDKVAQDLFTSAKRGYHIAGSNADSFFADLAEKLGCAAPPFLDTPFSHLKTVLKTITGFEAKDGASLDPQTEQALRRIDKAIDCIEPAMPCKADMAAPPIAPAKADDAVAALRQETHMRLMAGDFEAVLAQEAQIRDSIDDRARSNLAWAYVLRGNAESIKAKTQQPPASN